MKRFKIASLLIGVLLLVFISPAISMETSATISLSGNEGEVTVSASAHFESYTKCDNNDPPNCPTCNWGHFWVNYGHTDYCDETANDSAECPIKINAGVMSQGDHVFTVHVNDCDGVMIEDSVVLKVDNTPLLTVTSVDQSGGWINPAGTVDFKENPDGADGSVYVILDNDPKSYRYYEDFADWSWEDIAGSAILAASLSNGEHTIKIEARARNNAAAAEEFVIDIDNTPEVKINDIGEITGSFDVAGTVDFTEHPLSNDGFVELYFDGALQASAWVEESSWSFSQIVGHEINASLLSNGDHTVSVVAVARTAEQDSAQITFTIDNTPQITLDGPVQAEGQFDVTGEVTFKENLHGFEGYITYYINDVYFYGKNQDSANVSIKFSDYNGSLFDASKMTEGDHTFKLIAAASNGATKTSSVTVNIAKVDPLKNHGAANEACNTDPSADNSATQSYTVNPINFATGNKYKGQTDIVFAGPGLPLAFTRHYNSQLAFDGAMGYGWTGSYSDSITVSADTIILKQSDGRHVHFIDDGSGRYISDTGRVRTFTAHSDSYTLTEPGGTQKTFDLTGHLTRIRDTNGNTQSITYNDGKISTVSDNFGKSLSFEYNPDGRLSTLTTPVGVFAYGYYAAGNLDRVDNPDTTYRTYIYDDPNDPHNLTGITNENRIRSLTVTYDDQDRALTSELAGGARRVKVDYLNNYQRSVTDSLANTTDFQLYVSKGIARIKSSSGAGCSSCLASLEDSYELSDRLLIDSKTDAEGNQTDFTYDDRGNILTRTLAVGTPHERTTSYSWHPTYSKLATITRPSIANPGQTAVTTFGYDPAGNLRSVSLAGFEGTTPLTRTITYTYNANGQLETVDGPRTDVADVTRLTYYPNDASRGLDRGRLKKITNAMEQRILYADYNAWGRPQTVTDINDIITTFTFYDSGRLQSFKRNEKMTAYDYDDVGNLWSVTLPAERVIGYSYKDAGFVEKITDNMSNYIWYDYDSEGNRILEAIYDADEKLKKFTEFGYDEYNRLENVFYPGTDYEDYGWDKNGNPTVFVDAERKKVTRGYDPLNRLETLTQPGEVLTVYDYDAHDNLTRVTDDEDHQTVFTFNDLGDRLTEDSPDSGLTAYTYDQAGNLKSKTDANKITVTYQWDALNRLTHINYPDSQQDVTYTYDEGVYGKGLLSSITDQSGSYAYTYDADGNLVAETRTIAGLIYTTLYDYDPTGVLDGITYPNGRKVDYEPDPVGRVAKVTTSFGAATIVLADNLTYLPFGPLTDLDYGSGSHIEHSFDTRYQLSGIKAGSLMDLDYTRDAVGNVIDIKNNIDPAKKQVLGYDDLYRLTSATGVYGSIDYTYDDVGNRQTKTQNGQTDTYEYISGTNRLDRIIGANPQKFDYDDAGNTILTGAKSLIYNQNNRLSRVEQNGSDMVAYVYNSNGQRIKKIVENWTTIYHYDISGNLIAESDDKGVFERVYVYLGNKPLIRIESGENICQADLDRSGVVDGLDLAIMAEAYGQIDCNDDCPADIVANNQVDEADLASFAVDFGKSDCTTERILYYHYDHLGTPQIVEDQHGTIVWQANYLPFGAIDVRLAAQNNNLRFSGQLYDEETGLHYNYHRYYDPKTGRYLTPDPIGLDGGINPYVYTFNNPINKTDPYGLDAGVISIPLISVALYKAAAVTIGVSGGIVIGGALSDALSNAPYIHSEDEADDIIFDILYSEGEDSNENCPVPDAEPGRKTKGRTKQYEKPGDIETANEDFDSLEPIEVRDIPNGGRFGELPDGRKINVRPTSSDGRPTIEIQNGKNKIKIRYGQ